jgi:DNA-directed RNA polymerase subunit RPC12/RpoP
MAVVKVICSICRAEYYDITKYDGKTNKEKSKCPKCGHEGKLTKQPYTNGDRSESDG